MLQHLNASYKPKPSGGKQCEMAFRWQGKHRALLLPLKKQRVHCHQQDASRVTVLSIFKTNIHMKIRDSGRNGNSMGKY